MHLLNTTSTQDVIAIINSTFSYCQYAESVPLYDAVGRTLAQDVFAKEYVPSFHRSTVDGYAVRAADTFGCSDSIPAILQICGEVLMGQAADFTVSSNTCAAVPTGGAIPEGADAVVMLEYTEAYNADTVGILKPAVPGSNLIFKGDDTIPGKLVLQAGRILNPQDIGALAAMGCGTVQVVKKLQIGVISTGDELVPVENTPKEGQIRDVNTVMLCAMIKNMGCVPLQYPKIPDQDAALENALRQAVTKCDIVLISGGSSVGLKDATCRVMERQGHVLLHGISMKPGKPTLLANIQGKPVFGLPGNPVAACFVTQLFVRAAVEQLTGSVLSVQKVTAQLKQAVDSNHGREQFCAVRLKKSGDVIYAEPVRSKSGLITSLAGTDGYFCIPRDCEGMPRDSKIEVVLFQ